MLVEIAGDEMYFQTISLPGAVVDSGVITRPQSKEPAPATGGRPSGASASREETS